LTLRETYWQRIVTSRLRQQHLAYTKVRNNYFQQTRILKHSIIWWYIYSEQNYKLFFLYILWNIIIWLKTKRGINAVSVYFIVKPPIRIQLNFMFNRVSSEFHQAFEETQQTTRNMTRKSSSEDKRVLNDEFWKKKHYKIPKGWNEARRAEKETRRVDLSPEGAGAAAPAASNIINKAGGLNTQDKIKLSHIAVRILLLYEFFLNALNM